MFRKTNISFSLIHAYTCAYHGVRNITCSEIFTQVLNVWLQIQPSKHSSWRRLQDVFRLRLQKTSWSRRICLPLALRLQKTSSRRLQDVLVKTNIFVLAICLQDVFKTSSRRLQDVFNTSSRRFQDVFKTSSSKTSSGRFQDVFKTSCKQVFKTSSRRLQDVSSR